MKPFLIGTMRQLIEIICHATQLTDEVCLLYGQSLNDIDKKFILLINQLIDKNISNNEFAVTDITQAMAISRSLLHTKMKNLLNMSIGEYIRHKRLALASELLMKGFSVSETAYRCGFSDPNYFSKVFKKFYGKSPTEFIVALKKITSQLYFYLFDLVFP